MENINMYVVNIQWAIFFGFILINMLIGFKRGFKKTSYYTVVSIGLTLLLMFGISFITINWFFKNPVSIVEFVEIYIEIPENIRGIIINESVKPLLYVIIDIVLKIVVFIVIYPIIKFILTATIFKPIYKNTIGKNDKIKRPHLGSRLGGSLVGAVKGVFVAVMMLLPAIVLAGAFNQYNPTQPNTGNTSSNNYVLLEDGSQTEEQLAEIEKMMETIKIFHEEGLGNALSKFKLRGKSIDRQIFDLMFTSRVEDNQGNKVSVKLSEEIDSIGLIVQILVEKGYLEEGFDYKQINYDDHYEDLDQILNALGNSKMLNLAVPIAVEYLLNEESILDEITWTDEPHEYLEEKLSFILENNEFLKSELSSISALVGNVLKEGFDYNSFLNENGEFDPQLILLEENEAIINAALEGIGSLELVLNGLPLGIDYFLYTSNNTNIQELADQLSEIAQRQDYGDEIENINDIYSIAISLGLSQYFNKEDALVVTDRILSSEEGFTNVKAIINNIFVGSNAVNEVLDAVGEPILEKLIKEQELLDLALLVVSKENFSYGSEIVNLINIFELVYDEEDFNLTNIRETFNAKDYAKLANVFGSMEEEKFESFKESILNLQTIKFASKELVEFGASKLNNSFVVIPDNANYDSIKYDINKLFDTAYEAAKVIKSENLSTSDITNINIAQVIDLEEFTNLLNFDYTKDRVVLENSILLNSIIDNIVRRNNTSLGSFGTIRLPEGLNTRTVSEAWVDEINLIISGVFNVARAFSDEDETFILSINNLKTIKGLKDIPAEVGTRFSDEVLAEDTFTNLLTSKILTHNLYSLGLEQLDKFKIPNDIMTSELEGALKDGNNYVELISIFAGVLDYVQSDSAESLDTVVRKINLHNAFDIFNKIDEDEVDLDKHYIVRLARNDILNNAFREAAVHEYIQNQAYKFINGAKIPAPLNTVNAGIFDYKSALDDDNRLKEESLEELFLLIRDLELPGNMLKLPGGEVVSTLTAAFDDTKVEGLIEIDFMHDITSNIFLLDQMKEFISISAGFDYNDLTLSYTNRDEFENMTKEEVSDLFKGILSIGLTNFNNLSITTLKEADMDILLKSNYLYEVLDLTVKVQIDDIPAEALEPIGDEHEGLLRKEEFEGMIETLNILEIDNPNDLDADNISINQLDEVIAVDSFLVKKLISDQIKNFIEVPESSETNGIIKDLELQNIIESLLIINNNNREAKLSSIDSDNISITTTNFGEMLALNSNIIDRLISTEVIKTIDADVLFDLLENDGKDIIRDELVELPVALGILGIDELTSNIDTDEIEVVKLEEVTRPNNSIIINRLISESVYKGLEPEVPSTIVNNGYIEREEVNKLFKALDALSIDNVLEFKNDADFIDELTFAEIIEANNFKSTLFRIQISKQMIASSLVTENAEDFLDSIKVIPQEELERFFAAGESLDQSITTITELIDYIETTDLSVLADKVDGMETDPDTMSVILVDTIKAQLGL